MFGKAKFDDDGEEEKDETGEGNQEPEEDYPAGLTPMERFFGEALDEPTIEGELKLGLKGEEAGMSAADLEDLLNETREGRSSKRQLRIYKKLLRQAKIGRRKEHLEKMPNFYKSEEVMNEKGNKKKGEYIGNVSRKLYQSIVDQRTFDDYNRPVRQTLKPTATQPPLITTLPFPFTTILTITIGVRCEVVLWTSASMR
jgi:hypothetical protein